MSEVEVSSVFEAYHCDPEATVNVPALYAGDAPLQIHLAAAGGGTVGHAYADNHWLYEVHLAGTLVCAGVDLRSGGIPRTHVEMAVVLAECLADTDEVPELDGQRERLDVWAYDRADPSATGDEGRVTW